MCFTNGGQPLNEGHERVCFGASVRIGAPYVGVLHSEAHRPRSLATEHEWNPTGSWASRHQDLADGCVEFAAEGGGAVGKQVGHDGQRLLVAADDLLRGETKRLALSTCVSRTVSEYEPTPTYLVDGFSDSGGETRVAMQRRENPRPDVDRRCCLGDSRYGGNNLPPTSRTAPIFDFPLQLIGNPDSVEANLFGRGDGGLNFVPGRSNPDCGFSTVLMTTPSFSLPTTSSLSLIVGPYQFVPKRDVGGGGDVAAQP